MDSGVEGGPTAFDPEIYFFFSFSILFTKLIAAKDIYDHTTKYANTKVVVHEAVADGDIWPDQMEIVCPDVVDPGTFFLCHADIPRYLGETTNS